MRRVRLVVVAVLFVLGSFLACTGCGDDGDESAGGREAEKKGGNGYMGALARGYRKGREEPNLLGLRNELKQFQAMEGRWPESLKEFTEWRRADLPELREGREFDYDPETGELEIIETGDEP